MSILRTPTTLSQSSRHGTDLTARQREILLLIASGHNVTEIAELLNISPGTVENHKRRIYAKLHATSAAQAVGRAASLGIIDNHEPVPDARASRPVKHESGRAVLAVVVGEAGLVLDRVMTTLITHQLPVVREYCPQAVTDVDWLRWHRGPVVGVLPNPAPEHWRFGATLGRAAVMVHSGTPGKSAMADALSHGVLAVIHADHIEDQLVRILKLAAHNRAAALATAYALGLLQPADSPVDSGTR